MSRRLLVLLSMLLLSGTALAQATPVVQPGDLNYITAQYYDLSRSFYTAIESAAIKLLWALFGVEFAWFALVGVLKRQEIGEIMSGLIHSIFPPMVFLTVIKFGTVWLPQIIDSFWYFAETGTGIQRLDPVKLIQLGVNLQNEMVTRYYELSGAGDGLIDAMKNILPSMMLMFACIIILFAFAILALNFFLVQIEAYITIALAPMLFAFAGWRWTRDSALKTFNTLIAIGVKIVVLMFVLKVAINVTPLLAELGAAWSLENWTPLWLVAFTAVGLALLSIFAPKIAANALAGTSSLSAGDSVAGAAMVAGAALGAAGMAARPAGAAGGSLASGAGSLAKGAGDYISNKLSSGAKASGISPLDMATGGASSAAQMGGMMLNGMSQRVKTPTTSAAPTAAADFKPQDASKAEPATIGGTQPQQEKKSMLDRVAEVAGQATQSGRGVVDNTLRAGHLDGHQAGGDFVKLKE